MHASSRRHRGMGNHAEVRRLEAVPAQVVCFRNCGYERKAHQSTAGKGSVQRRNQIATVNFITSTSRCCPTRPYLLLQKLKRRELGIGGVCFLEPDAKATRLVALAQLFILSSRSTYSSSLRPGVIVAVTPSRLVHG